MAWRQPDWVLVSHELKRIAILELFRPSGVLPSQLLMTAKRKQHAYETVNEALSYDTDQGWIIHIFPWVVGIRGMIDPRHVESLLKFLGIQRKHWQVAVERSVLASVRAFHFLHTVRFGGRPEAMRTAFEPEDSDSEQDDSEENVIPKRKVGSNLARTALDNGDSDSSACSEEKPKQQRTTSSNPRLPTEADENDPSSTRVPGPTHRASSTHRCPASTQRAMRRASQQPPSKRRGMSARPTASKMHTVGLTSSGRTSQVARRPQPKRKHCERTKQETELDTDETDQRPAKQDRYQQDYQLEAPWKRWRQLEPRREWRI